MDKLLQITTNFAAQCQPARQFFNFPTWYKYLPCEGDQVVDFELVYIWLILAAALEMILYAAGLLAVGLFIYGGFIFITSQGNPEKVASGRQTMLNATIGLVIAIMSANIVALIAGAFN